MFSDETGTSLLEVLIAVLVVSLALVTFLTALVTGILGTATVNERVMAANLAVSQMDSIKNAPYTTTVTAYPTIALISTDRLKDFSDFSIVITASTVSYTITIMSTPTAVTDTQWITVTVLHNGRFILALEDYKVNR
jgi:type II secretory pathway pseudopilin PulG